MIAETLTALTTGEVVSAGVAVAIGIERTPEEFPAASLTIT